MNDEMHNKILHSITVSGYQCKTKADLQAEYIRIFTLCENTGLNKLSCIRVGGVPLSLCELEFVDPELKPVTYQDLVLKPERCMPKFDKPPEEYSFARAILENKPVFAGDVIFLRPHALVYEAGSDSRQDPRSRLSPKILKGRNEVTVLIDSSSQELHVRFNETSFLKDSILGEPYHAHALALTGRVPKSFLTWMQSDAAVVYEEPHIFKEKWEASKVLGVGGVRNFV
ncbi:MAG: hypothetical protein HY799_06040 [Nitrosomonadales bacterium]|nr:hypothetical protein [Nitrosomonadales bacterium]